jgi:hypothetical protein
MNGLPAVLVRASVLGACFSIGLTVPTYAQQQVAGLVKTVAGNAVIVRGGQEFPAALGQAVNRADTLRTGADGKLGVTLKDGTRLSLGQNSEIHLSEFAYSPAEGQLALVIKVLRGVTSYISGRVAELSPGAVKIETPASVIGVRGTHLLVGVDLP